MSDFSFVPLQEKKEKSTNVRSASPQPQKTKPGKTEHHSMLEAHLRDENISEIQRNKAIGELMKVGEHKFVRTYFQAKADKEFMDIGYRMKRRRDEGGGSQTQVVYPDERPVVKARRRQKGSKGSSLHPSAPRRAWMQPIKHNAENFAKDSKFVSRMMAEGTYDALLGVPGITEARARQLVTHFAAEGEQIGLAAASVPGSPSQFLEQSHRHDLMFSALQESNRMRFDFLREVGGDEAVNDALFDDANTTIDYVIDTLLLAAEKVDAADKPKTKAPFMFMGINTDELMEVGEQFTQQANLGPAMTSEEEAKRYLVAHKSLKEQYDKKQEEEGKPPGLVSMLFDKLSIYIDMIWKRKQKKDETGEEVKFSESATQAKRWYTLGWKAVVWVLKVVVGALIAGLLIYAVYHLATSQFDVSAYVASAEGKVDKMTEATESLRGAVNTSVESGVSELNTSIASTKSFLTEEVGRITKNKTTLEGMSVAIDKIKGDEKYIGQVEILEKAVDNLTESMDASAKRISEFGAEMLPSLFKARGEFENIQSAVNRDTSTLLNLQNSLKSTELKWIKWAYELTKSGSPLYTALSRAAVNAYNTSGLQEMTGVYIDDNILLFIERVTNLESLGVLERTITGIVGSVMTINQQGIWGVVSSLSAGFTNFYTVIVFNPLAQAALKWSVRATAWAAKTMSKLVGYSLMACVDIMAYLFAGKDEDFAEFADNNFEEIKNDFARADKLVAKLDAIQQVKEEGEGVECPADSNFKKYVCEIFIKFIPESGDALVSFNETLLRWMNRASSIISLFQMIQMVVSFMSAISSLFLIMMTSVVTFGAALLVVAGAIYLLWNFKKPRRIASLLGNFVIAHPTVTMLTSMAFLGLVHYLTAKNPPLAEAVADKMASDYSPVFETNSSTLETAYDSFGAVIGDADAALASSQLVEVNETDYTFVMNIFNQYAVSSSI